jgi:hypothetical protein
MINKNDFPLLGQKYSDLLVQQKLRNFSDMSPSMRNMVIQKFIDNNGKLNLEEANSQIQMNLTKEDVIIFYLANAIQYVLNKKYEIGERLQQIAETEKRKFDLKSIGKKRQKVLSHILEIDALRSQGYSFPQITKTLFRGKGKISVDYMKEVYYQNKKLLDRQTPQPKESALPLVPAPPTFIESAPKNFKPKPKTEIEEDFDFLKDLLEP